MSCKTARRGFHNQAPSQPETHLTISHAPVNEPLILASGSRYRKELLGSFTPEFTCISPDIDERRLPGESPRALASRLASQKAAKIAKMHPEATVIGSDQVASLNGIPLQKPGNYEKAVEQLTLSSGKTVYFHTCVCLISPLLKDARCHTDLTKVHFRILTADEIEAYVAADQPFDCAGSFRSEGLGAGLFASVDNSDPTALIGLPMHWLTRQLEELGYRAAG